MVVLSAHLAVLVPLCAVVALAIPPRVEAAHLYDGHAMEKRNSIPHSHPWVHGDKNDHHMEHRALDLPPLLRRYRAPNQTKQPADYQDEESRNDNVARSAFARSRYRRGLVPHGRRSSVYFSGEDGNTYLISRASSKHGEKSGKHASHGHHRRQVDESDLALGRIDIMGVSESPGSAQRLGSLTIDSAPIDWTTGQTTSKAFSLNASTVNQTQFVMTPMDDSLAAAGSSPKHVTLATEVFDAGSASMVMYCATYNPDPGATSALIMAPCKTEPVNDAGDPCMDKIDDADPSSFASQIFAYDPFSGKIEPMSVATNATGPSGGNRAATLAACVGTHARARRDASNATTTSGTATPSRTVATTAPAASGLEQARNVTLVYVAGALQVPAPSPSASNATTSATASATLGQAPVLVVTTTLTTTVVSSARAPAASGSAGRTVTPPQAAASAVFSSLPASVSSPTPSASVRSSTGAASTSSGTPADADESFEVEIVGVTASGSARSASSSTTTSARSSSAPPDPQVVASLVASGAARRAEASAWLSLVR